MRKILPIAAPALLLAGLILIVDYFAFTRSCEARSANHIRFVLGPCLVVTEDGVQPVEG